MSSKEPTPEQVIAFQKQLAKCGPISFTTDEPLMPSQPVEQRDGRLAVDQPIGPKKSFTVEAATEETVAIIQQMDAIANRMIQEPTLRFDPVLGAQYDDLERQLWAAQKLCKDARWACN